MTREEVEVDGCRLAYERWGSGPPLYALHGGPGGSRTYWRHAVPRLGEVRTVHALDLRGHGESDRRGPYTVAALAADVPRVMDALSHDRVDLLGHSYGAAVALEVALRYPERVARLLLVGGFPRTWRVIAHPRHLGTKLRLGARLAGWVAAERLGRKPDARDTLRRLLRDAEPLMHGPRPDAWKDELLFESVLPPHDPVLPLAWDLLRWSAWASIPTLRPPLLLVRGEHDALAAPDAARFVARAPRGRLAVVPDAGHSPFLDRPEAFEGVVLPFLAEPV